MSTIRLEAELRKDIGKGASRRLRRLENKIPAIVYGGDKPAQSIHLQHNKLLHALEVESIYSSVLDLAIDGKVQHVILKDLQRHPFKPVILHMDLLRVNAKDMIVKMVPLHFINEDKTKGLKAGGLLNHAMTQVEVRCQVKDLPEFIEVDLAGMDLNDVLHLSDLKLPKGVHLVIDAKTDEQHNHPVVSIHLSKAEISELDETETAESTDVEEAEAETKAEDDSAE